MSANNITGTYTVNASSTGAPTGATFTLTNTVIYYNVDLSQLTLSTGTLHPDFASTTTSYAVTTHALKISVTPTAADPTSTITVNGAPVASGSASGEIPLTIGGDTTITIVVTAPDGFTNKTYTVIVTQDGADYLVTNNADSGPGSLRYGLASVGANATISFDNDYTITLASQLELNKTITITGLGHRITLDGHHTVRVLHVPGGVHPTLDHLHIINGNFSSDDCAGAAYKCGGGMLLEYNAAATVTNCTFSGNGASNSSGVGIGGAIYSYYGNLTVMNSTFSGNNAYIYGGAIDMLYGSATLINNTFVGNSADGFGDAFFSNWCAVTLSNNLFTNNTATTGGANCSGDFTDNGGNLENGNSCGFSTAKGSFPNTNPLLGPLANNGGSTPTFALLPNSPAIDAGNQANCPSIDQRGEPRADLRCDIGAYEIQHSDSDTVIKTFADTTTHSFGPTWVSVTLAAVDTGALTVTKHLTYPGGTYDEGEIPATWWISSTLGTGLPATLSLCYTDDEVAGLDESSLEMFRWNGSAWVDQNATPDPDNNCVKLTGISGFSAWTLAASPATPTAARGVGLAARGFAPVAALLALGGAVALFRRRQRPDAHDL